KARVHSNASLDQRPHIERTWCAGILVTQSAKKSTHIGTNLGNIYPETRHREQRSGGPRPEAIGVPTHRTLPRARFQEAIPLKSITTLAVFATALIAAVPFASSSTLIEG